MQSHKMIEKKRKSRDGKKHDRPQKFTRKSKFSKKRGKIEDDKRRTGPRLPQSLRIELDRINPNDQSGSEEDEEGINDDVYEYEEGVPEEESKKNRRFDSVENYEYELPKDFKDENVDSDDDDDFDGGENKIAHHKGKKGDLDQLDDDVEDEDDERHLRMLQGITGMPSQAFQDRKKTKVVSEGYPESEYNPTRDVLDGDGRIAIEDLLESIQGKPGYRELRKITRQVEKKGKVLQAPLPKEDRDRLERSAAYEQSKKDITRWEPLVKRNREAPTIMFDKDTDSGFSTIGAIASEFEPRTEFEKKMSSLVNDDNVMAAHKEDGSRLLELNKISLEDYISSRNHIAKMRSLLFRHEVKMKRVKKIKSKTYHRLLKKDRLKGSVGIPMDAEEAKELAMKQEFKRAEERMTLRHKNQSKWAQRIVKRGIDAQDEGTRAAMAEQLHQHALLTRKMNSMKDSSSSDDSSDEEDNENSDGSDEDKAPKLLAQAREKTRRVLEEDDGVPDSGVLSLPFMKRALKKRKEAADEEGRLAIQEFESSLKELEDTDEAKITKTGTVSGRRVFGASKTQDIEPKNKIRSSSYSSDSEAELEAQEDIDIGLGRTDDMQNNINVNSVSLYVDADIPQDSVLKNSELVKDLGSKMTYEVSILQSNTWKKMSSSQNEVDTNGKRSQKVVEPATHNQDIEFEGVGEDSDADSEGPMLDGILSSEHKSSYKLPSQAELIREAFAGDDVQEEFNKDKEEIMNLENPEPEKPAQLPGWGQWTRVQKKKGLPSWVLEEHENAKKKREEALRKRKDAHLKHVIISEKLDKKAEKLLTGTLPYPFTSKEVFEQSIRMPIGPEFNPATAVRALNRPEVVKKQGLIIKPIRYEDVDSHERGGEERRKSGQKQKIKRSKGRVKAVVAKS
ncbi:U3 SMALL NUCLEOLAR RNA-ASSOCIATED PROTEIN 14 [Salix koriyanagi]|uniref:U3 SMALL NUCLEOLAR RNA-ASSOCIATED PROTEIN 14 n=1 Tax=Salix koriyanagi TaxID=2511006 RepID=A0A9Q0TF70_9ROSI|nr:U3 SMALL NUCLEOLAR RNA-ASSOCIATED PROTEIN 14 [Salix koriyanagi]